MQALSKVKNKITGKKEPTLSNEGREAVLIHSATRAKSEAEQNWQNILGSNYELVHDDDIEKLLSDLMYYRKVVKDSQGNEVVINVGVNENMASLRLILSNLNRCAFLQPSEYPIMKLKLRNMVRYAKLQMNPQQYNLGTANFFRAVGINFTFLLNDALGGRKATLLKTSPQVTSVEVKEGEQAQKKGLF